MNILEQRKIHFDEAKHYTKQANNQLIKLCDKESTARQRRMITAGMALNNKTLRHIGNVMALGCLMIFLFIIGCGGEQKLTREQWDAQFKPSGKKEAKAMVALERGRSEIKQEEKSQGFYRMIRGVCVIFVVAGLVGGIVAMIWNMKNLSILLFSIFIGGIAGVSMLELLMRKPGIFVWFGATLLIVIGGYAIWLQFNKNKANLANIEFIKNIESIKHIVSQTTGNKLELIKSILKEQSPSTQKIVAAIRGKLSKEKETANA